MTDKTLEARLEALETTAAYQDKLIEDLNAALIEHYRQIEALKHHLARIGEQVEEIGANPALMPGREPPPPPHY